MSDLLLEDILADIEEFIEIVITRTANIHSADDFISDDNAIILFDSVLMRLQAIGELFKSAESRYTECFETHKNDDITGIIKLRDIISHHYIDLDADIIFDICKNHLPNLMESIRVIRKNCL